MPDVDHDQELADLAGAAEGWRTAFVGVGVDVPRVQKALEAALVSAPSSDLHQSALELLVDVAAEGQRAVRAVQRLEQQVAKLQKEWEAEHRYTQRALDDLLSTLASTLLVDASKGAQDWLDKLLDAADDGEVEAAVRIATAELPWSEKLRPGAAVLGDSFASWREDARHPELTPLEDLTEGRLEGWDAVVSPRALRSRVHRFAAWVALRGRGDHDAARRHIDKAVELYPYTGRMHAERAELHLFVGDFPRAAIDAQYAIETRQSEPLGHLALGMWAELTGKFSGADDLYKQGIDLLSTVDIVRIPQRTALVDPTGRLLTAGAKELIDDRLRPQEALALIDEALLSGIRGSEAHPEAVAYRVRRRALESLPEPVPRKEAAEAALEAGRMFIWNGDLECAIEELGRAIELDTTEEAGWLLADALVSKSFPLGAALPDQDMVHRAGSAWDHWAEKAGHPRGETSWAYVTRAIIADLQSQRTDADRRPGVFQAVMFVEKALLHDDTDAQRWGYAAQFLRYAGLLQLAFEAAERGYSLAATERQVLAERLPLLASRRQFEEAEVVAQRLVTMFGEDPWVSAVRAWLALHYKQRFSEALQLLELPLAEGSDHAWYRHMEALAHLGQGRRDKARESFRHLLDAPPLDGNTKCRLALAHLALGERDASERCLAEAGSEPMTRRSTFLMTAAIAALAGDDLEYAVHLLEQSIGLCTSEVQIEDVLFETVLMLRALDRGEEWREATEQFLRRAVAPVSAQQVELLARHPPTADDELEAALARCADGDASEVEETALLAVAARRHATAGRVTQAVEAYQRLQGSSFEPEASVGLERVRARLAV